MGEPRADVRDIAEGAAEIVAEATVFGAVYAEMRGRWHGMVEPAVAHNNAADSADEAVRMWRRRAERGL